MKWGKTQTPIKNIKNIAHSNLTWGMMLPIGIHQNNCPQLLFAANGALYGSETNGCQTLTIYFYPIQMLHVNFKTFQQKHPSDTVIFMVYVPALSNIYSVACSLSTTV